MRRSLRSQNNTDSRAVTALRTGNSSYNLLGAQRLNFLMDLQQSLYSDSQFFNYPEVLSNDFGAFSNSTQVQQSYLSRSYLDQVGFLSSPFSSLERAIARSQEETPKIKKVLSSEGRSKLLSKKYSKSLPHGGFCPITQLEFTEGDIITCLPCGHYFDPASINRWVSSTSASCPVCRHELPYKEVSELPESTNESALGNSVPEGLLPPHEAIGGDSPFVTVLTYHLSW